LLRKIFKLIVKSTGSQLIQQTAGNMSSNPNEQFNRGSQPIQLPAGNMSGNPNEQFNRRSQAIQQTATYVDNGTGNASGYPNNAPIQPNVSHGVENPKPLFPFNNSPPEIYSPEDNMNAMGPQGFSPQDNVPFAVHETHRRMLQYYKEEEEESGDNGLLFIMLVGIFCFCVVIIMKGFASIEDINCVLPDVEGYKYDAEIDAKKRLSNCNIQDCNHPILRGVSCDQEKGYGGYWRNIIVSVGCTKKNNAVELSGCLHKNDTKGTIRSKDLQGTKPKEKDDEAGKGSIPGGDITGGSIKGESIE